MKLREKQSLFVQNVYRLIQFAYSNGFELTFGEAWRSPETQKIYVESGRSKTMNSRHLDRLAIDFNIFKDDKMLFSDKAQITADLQTVQKLGNFWMSINTDNVWGGDWNRNYNVLDETFRDPYHFEMKN